MLRPSTPALLHNAVFMSGSTKKIVKYPVLISLILITTLKSINQISLKYLILITFLLSFFLRVALYHFICFLLFSLFNFKSRSFISSPKGKGKGKGKAIPLQAWTGPEGSRRLRLPDFKTIGT